MVATDTDLGNLLVVLGGKLDLLEVGDDAICNRVLAKTMLSREKQLTLVDRLGNDRVATVCAPCDEDLGSGSTELVGDLLDLRVVDDLRLARNYMRRISQHPVNTMITVAYGCYPGESKQ